MPRGRPALANLIGEVGRTLKPKVFCVPEGADQGAGHPDYALYTAKQVQKGRPREGQVPERGVVEVKEEFLWREWESIDFGFDRPIYLVGKQECLSDCTSDRVDLLARVHRASTSQSS
ncbi:MAG: hypothetical protein OXF01_12865 [Gemmatimonadetes bacterium]|nr:hypothetical protein [Gemmatimonadota bacterium]